MIRGKKTYTFINKESYLPEYHEEGRNEREAITKFLRYEGNVSDYIIRRDDKFIRELKNNAAIQLLTKAIKEKSIKNCALLLLQLYEIDINPIVLYEINFWLKKNMDIEIISIDLTTRKETIVFAKYLFMYYIYKSTNLNFVNIGLLLGVNHSSVTHAIKSINTDIEIKNTRRNTLVNKLIRDFNL